ncbi:cytochrome P450 [Mycena olivaceomarginata]|nr:cytochrome P450 [Mycena olivaceomarginata]
MLQLLVPPQYGDHEFTWLKEFGSVYLVKGCFGQNRLMISDPSALQYILIPPHFEHGPALDKCYEFNVRSERCYGCERLTERLGQMLGVPDRPLSTLSQATLSAISEAVLGCSTHDLGEAFVANNERVIPQHTIIADAIVSRLPKMVWAAAAHLPTATFKVLRAVKSLARQIGRQAVADKLAAIQQRTNTRTDVFDMLLDPERSDRKKNMLTEEELVAQTGILMIGGQDTVTSTLVFGCIELARHPEFQHNYAQKSMRHPVVQPSAFLMRVCHY